MTHEMAATTRSRRISTGVQHLMRRRSNPCRPSPSPSPPTVPSRPGSIGHGQRRPAPRFRLSPCSVAVSVGSGAIAGKNIIPDLDTPLWVERLLEGVHAVSQLEADLGVRKSGSSRASTPVARIGRVTGTPTP